MELAPIQNPQELLQVFKDLEDWESRYSFIIELAQELPELPSELHAPEYMVHGCQSNVWIVPEVKETERGIIIDFKADSDSQIVKGLISILHILYSNKTPAEILSLDIEDLFSKLALRKHLTPGRSNGLTQMIKRIQDLAKLANAR